VFRFYYISQTGVRIDIKNQDRLISLGIVEQAQKEFDREKNKYYSLVSNLVLTRGIKPRVIRLPALLQI
jgi:hypothetical protein